MKFEFNATEVNMITEALWGLACVNNSATHMFNLKGDHQRAAECAAEESNIVKLRRRILDDAEMSEPDKNNG